MIGQAAFRELFELRAASVIQPDITHCGGLSEARRIAAMAEAYRVALAPHNPHRPREHGRFARTWLCNALLYYL